MKTLFRDIMFKTVCRYLGHNFKKTKLDQARCCQCGRVYYTIPGEFE